MKKLIVCLFILSTAMVNAQNKEIETYKNAMGINEPIYKIEALKNFTIEFPKSNYSPRAYFDIARSYLEVNNTDSALVFADKYVNFYPLEGRLNPYNNIAYTLIAKKTGLDTALAYSQRAIQFARSKNIPNISMYLDTYAAALYALGKNQEALNAQTEAIKGHEDDPEFLLNLAIYQDAVGNTKEALNTTANVLLKGDAQTGMDKFNEWLKKIAPDGNARVQLKKEISERTVNNFLKSGKEEDKVGYKSTAAVFYSAMILDLDTAETWALESVNSINKSTTIEDQIQFHKNLALVYASEDKTKIALKELIKVENYVDPWDAGFWLTLGNIYEKQKDNKNALDAYVSGLYAFENPTIKAAVMILLDKMNLKEEDLKNMIEKKQKASTTFETGKYTNKSKGKVLLAELFTGAECGPCQSADVAFDKLSEYFPRNTLAIIEYHVNIPGPDPMTNPNTFSRYMYYGGNFGTPTAILEGKEMVTGGGPKYLAANRFSLYKYALSKYENQKPEVIISGKAVKEGNNINLNLNLKGKTKDQKCVLHIALVEKSVNYTGSNTIDKHRFVVRSLIDNESGTTIASNKISKSLDLNKIEDGLKNYLDDPTKQPSWRQSFGPPSWKARTDKLNRDNLAVVAWIQNPETREIINSIFVDIK
jgi:tetratricopeptide (TPR) repeat protein